MRKELKERAVELRKQGLTYTEIAAVIPMSKATLSDWLHNVPLPLSYYEKVERLRTSAREKGAKARKDERKERTASIIARAKNEVEALKNNPLWLVGLSLYWAEGSKEKQWGRGVPVTFTNMDVDTVCIFRAWCKKFLETQEEDFSYSVYIHDTQRANTETYIAWWASALDISTENIDAYYKHSKINHTRKNDSEGYRGVFRLTVKRSVDSNRRISGWISGMIRSLRSL